MTKESHREKVIHVHYTEDPKARSLREQANQLKSKNSVLKQKIDFQERRISFGSDNYMTAVEKVGENSVRRLRKSNMNAQNFGVTIKHDNSLPLEAWLSDRNVEHTPTRKNVLHTSVNVTPTRIDTSHNAEQECKVLLNDKEVTAMN